MGDTSKSILNLFESKKYINICAPMVRYSKLQFRTLVRNYGCDLCYTPMILADSFCKSSKARLNEFTTNSLDKPLIVQFAANTVQDFVGASYLVAPYCQGVDLNCGCPQRWAKQMGLGCALLNKPELISDMVKQCRNQISSDFSVSTKIRLLPDQKKAIELCRQLENANISFLSIHARTPNKNVGDIDVDTLKLIVDTIKCPVVANGGIKTLKDAQELQANVNCKGIMVANSILTNPELFSTNAAKPTLNCVQNFVDICYNATINDYEAAVKSTNLFIAEKPANLTFQCFHHHLVFMLEKLLPKRKRCVFNNLQSFADVLSFLNDEFCIQPKLYNEDLFQLNVAKNLDYTDRSNVYLSLKEQSLEQCNNDDICQNYDYEEHQGKYFINKVNLQDDEYHLTDVFIEND